MTTRQAILILSFLALVSLPWALKAQIVVVKQGFESSGETWPVISGGGNISPEAGSTDTPAAQRIRTGVSSWQVNNATATLELASVSTAGRTNMKVVLHLSSPSITSANGSDASDSVRVFVALNGAPFSSSSTVTVHGNNNARWGYNALLTATGSAGSYARYQAPQGGTNTNNYSTVEITIPDGTTSVALRVVASNNAADELWCVDDILLTVPASNDLALNLLSVEPALPTPTSQLTLRARVVNLGLQPASGYSVDFYLDSNDSQTPEPGELFASVPGSALARGDSTTISTTHPPLAGGDHRFIAVVNFPADEILANNTGSADVTIGFLPHALVINEIMYAPFTDQAEWVELYNPTSSSVDLKNWTLSDMRTASGSQNVFSVTRNRLVVPAGGYAVVSSDSSIYSLFPSLRTPPSNVIVTVLNRSSLSLNNDGDDVIIKDFAGTIIDSLRYSPSWNNPDLSDTRGISLERINPNLSSTDRRNWSSSVERVGGTPGKQNSIFTTALPAQVALSISPNPFSPDGDGLEDFAVISYELKVQVAQIRIKVYDSVGRLVRTLANNEPSGPRGQIIWDGLDDDKRKLRMGIYVIFLEAIDSAGGTVESAKAAAVVAGRL
jgi:hypothetical protein